MASKQQMSPSSLSTARSTMVSDSISINLMKSPFDNLYNISPLLKRMRNQRSSKMTHSISESSIRLTNTPLPLNQLKHNGEKFHRRKRQSLKYLSTVLNILQNKHVDRGQEKGSNSIVRHIV